VSPLALPPHDLAGFPEHLLPAGTPLFRVHRAVRGPWWFSSDGSGRFDLAPPRGTCHLAAEPIGAFLEVFRDVHLIDPRDVTARRLSRLELPRPLRLADCTAARSRGFGVTAALHATPEYSRVHTWAAAFAGAGLDGVRYRVSHDPSQRLAGYALFGEAGVPADGALWPPGTRTPIPGSVLREAKERFGILALPAG
jgi:hypothetical protein